ncbi:MAG: hypothetical protein AAF998_06875 [Bacteroidota bacterium]
MTNPNDNLYPLTIRTELGEKPTPQAIHVLNADKQLIATIKAREIKESGQRMIYYQLYDRDGKTQVSERSLEYLVGKHLRELAPRLQKIAQAKEVTQRKETLERSQRDRSEDRTKERRR